MQDLARKERAGTSLIGSHEEWVERVLETPQPLGFLTTDVFWGGKYGATAHLLRWKMAAVTFIQFLPLIPIFYLYIAFVGQNNFIALLVLTYIYRCLFETISRRKLKKQRRLGPSGKPDSGAKA